MKKQAISAVIILVIAFALLMWRIVNLINVFKCDFASPYKCEVLRVAGVVVPPLWAIMWYINVWK